MLDENALISVVRSNRHITINVLFMLFISKIFVLDINMSDVINRLRLIRSVDIGSLILVADVMLGDEYMENNEKRVSIDSVLHNDHHFFDCLHISD